MGGTSQASLRGGLHQPYPQPPHGASWTPGQVWSGMSKRPQRGAGTNPGDCRPSSLLDRAPYLSPLPLECLALWLLWLLVLSLPPSPGPSCAPHPTPSPRPWPLPVCLLSWPCVHPWPLTQAASAHPLAGRVVVCSHL